MLYFTTQELTLMEGTLRTKARDKASLGNKVDDKRLGHRMIAQANQLVLLANKVNSYKLAKAAEAQNAAQSKISTYFVLNGLLDGEDGMYAMPLDTDNINVKVYSGPLEDGWYFVHADEKDGVYPDGHGVFDSKEEAEQGGGLYAANLTLEASAETALAAHERQLKGN